MQKSHKMSENNCSGFWGISKMPDLETQRYIASEITNYIVSNGYGSRAAFAEHNKSLLIQAKNAFGSMENVDKIILSLSTFMLAA